VLHPVAMNSDILKEVRERGDERTMWMCDWSWY
jgi:hypothetical protein